MTDFNPSSRLQGDFMQPRLTLGDRLKSLVIIAAPNILVVDISHYNGDVDFAALRASNVQGVIMKVSESTNYKDTMFEDNWREARNAGFAVMLYHFFRDNPGADEFDWFMQCAANFLDDVEGNTAVALDVETNNGVSASTRADRAFEFCNLAKQAGLLDGIYCSPSLVNSLFPYGELRWSYLSWQWVAHWTSASTYTLPAGWNNSLVKAWQFGIYPKHSWCPKVTGAGTVDVNRFYFENEDALKDWLGQSEQEPDYPFGVQVTTSAVVRAQADSMANPLWVAPKDTGLVVFDATEDVNDKLWYYIGGSGWVKADHVATIADPIVPPPPPPPPPPADDTLVYTVTADKTLARFIYGYNDAGKPIFQIYPGDSITEGRFRYDEGAQVSVWPEPIRGDGGGDFYKMAMSPVAGCDLYLYAADGILS